MPNLLAGGLPAGALPGLALACAADKRAQHTRATQKSTTRARHTKRDAWIYTGDITAAIEMEGAAAKRPPPHLYGFCHIELPCMIHPCVSLCVARVCLSVWRACVVLFCVARVCCALLSAASARPAGKPPAKRLGKHRASRASDATIF